MSTEHDDPEGVFEPTESAIAADARKLLLRAGVLSPTAQQIDDARESARLILRAQAEHVIRTGRLA